MEGVTDAQARQMAEDLDFKGAARDEVRVCVPFSRSSVM